MTVTLYNYTGMDNVANKLLSRLCTKVWEGDITTYGAFTPRGGVFRLSNLYQCNYCTFQYDGITYYANVDISTDSKGLYVYTCTTDSLATCFYKGCMNSVQFYKYVSDWTELAPHWSWNLLDLYTYDNRITFQNIKYIEQIEIEPRQGESVNDVWYVMCVLDYDSNQFNREGPSVITYAMNHAAYVDLLEKKISKVTFVPYAAQIRACYVVPSIHITGPQPAVDHITFYRPAEDMGGSTIDLTPNRWDVPSGGRCLNISARSSYSRREKRQIDFDITPNNMWQTQCMHVQDVGDIYFTFADVYMDLFPDTRGVIQRAGYDLTYNFTDGIMTALLRINDVTFPEYSVTARIPYQVSIWCDSYLKDMKSVQYQFMNNALNVGANIANSNYGGAVMSSANGAVSISEAVYQEQKRDALAPTTVMGNASNSMDNALNRSSYLRITSLENNASSVKSLFGQMLFGKFNIYQFDPSGPANGYHMTQVCNLPNNGLPKYIVQEANGRCDAGYIIAPSNPANDPYNDAYSNY